MQKKVAMALLLTGSFGIGMISSVVPNVNSNSTDVAQAKTTSARVISSKKLAKHAVHATKGHIYSSTRLTKTTHYAKNYKHTTFYRTKQAKVVKANGKKSIYQYIKTSNGKVRGWIWHGYLKNGKAPKKGVSSDSTAFNVDKVNQDFLAIVNKEREKNHLNSLRMDTQLMKIATQLAVNYMEGSNGKDPFPSEMKHPDLDILGCHLFSGGFDNDNRGGKIMANEFLHPTFSSDTKESRYDLLDSDATAIGIGWYKGCTSFVLGGKFDDSSYDVDDGVVDSHTAIISGNADGSWTLTINSKLVGTFNSEAEVNAYLDAHQ